jgi:hypothetical protein
MPNIFVHPYHRRHRALAVNDVSRDILNGGISAIYFIQLIDIGHKSLMLALGDISGAAPVPLPRRESAFKEDFGKSQELEILIMSLLGVSKTITPKFCAGPDPCGTCAG